MRKVKSTNAPTSPEISLEFCRTIKISKTTEVQHQQDSLSTVYTQANNNKNKQERHSDSTQLVDSTEISITPKKEICVATSSK